MAVAPSVGFAMILRSGGVIVAGGLALLIALAVVLLTESNPSTENLDQDLASVRKELLTATAESSKYSGGLIKGLIDVRAEILQVTETMLKAKRTATIRRIEMRFNVDGRALSPSSASELSKIKDDIDVARGHVAAAEIKAKQYTGGLVHVMALTTAETERLTLAQLHLAYYSAKYGLATPRTVPLTSGGTAKPPSPGSVVKDKDAL